VGIFIFYGVWAARQRAACVLVVVIQETSTTKTQLRYYYFVVRSSVLSFEDSRIRLGLLKVPVIMG